MHSGVQLLPGEHTLRDVEVVKFLRRRNPRYASKLMSYVIGRLNRVVVALWVNRLQGVVTELAAYDRDSQPDLELVQQVEFNLSNERRVSGIKEWVGKQLSMTRAQTRWQQEMHMERKEARDYYKKQFGANPDDPRWLAAI